MRTTSFYSTQSPFFLQSEHCLRLRRLMLRENHNLTLHVSRLRHGRPQVWARGALTTPWKCCMVFLCISSYSKTLSRLIIYALFWQLSQAFGGLAPDLHRGSIRGPYWGSWTPNLPTPGKNPAGAHGLHMCSQTGWRGIRCPRRAGAPIKFAQSVGLTSCCFMH